MITITLCALLCAAATLYLIAPLVKTRPRMAYTLMVLFPLLSLALYLLIGSPLY